MCGKYRIFCFSPCISPEQIRYSKNSSRKWSYSPGSLCFKWMVRRWKSWGKKVTLAMAFGLLLSSQSTKSVSGTRRLVILK